MDLVTSYQYLAPSTRIYGGVNALQQLRREANRIGAKRAFVIGSRTVARSTDLLRRVREVLADLYCGTYDGATRESPISAVMAGVEAVKAAQPDVIVAVGGGSAVVTARAVTILVGEGRSVDEMYTKHIPGQAPVVYRANRPKIPNILVLTTPTTAADRGGAAVWDEHPPHRKELYDPKSRPLCTIMDGQALLTAPLPLYLDTSLTTFTGTVHALQSPALNPFQFADLRQALELAMEFLPQLMTRPDDPYVRIQLCATALLVNRASQSTYGWGGPRPRTAGLGRQLRYRYDHIGQGAAGAVLLATEMRWSREAALQGQVRLAEIMRVDRHGMAPEAVAEAAAQGIEALLRSIGVATRLRDLGVQEADLEAIAAADLAEPGFGEQSDARSTVEELLGILRQAW
ncbi:MAG TPA: iron-containing alcohol dehydrogenase [Candidatus Tectomicrobia bacterium]|nr:iron-containing alcohol dehydrogenase [Candidatus Tectomicrobia bacterium]